MSEERRRGREEIGRVKREGEEGEEGGKGERTEVGIQICRCVGGENGDTIHQEILGTILIWRFGDSEVNSQV